MLEPTLALVPHIEERLRVGTVHEVAHQSDARRERDGVMEPIRGHKDGVSRPADGHVRCRLARTWERVVLGREGIQPRLRALCAAARRVELIRRDALAGVDQMRLRGRVQDELFRAAYLREPRVRVVRVVMQPCHCTRRSEEDFGQTVVEARVVGRSLALGNIVGHEVGPADVRAQRLVVDKGGP